MSPPRLDIRLDRLHHNARTLVDRLATRGVAVTGVTKATLGSPEVAATLLAAGVAGLGDSRIENVERLRGGGIDATVTLLRSPMSSQAARVVGAADVSLNADLGVVGALDAAARAIGRRHGVVLMVELGDLREGLMPADVVAAARWTVGLDNVRLVGLGANLACQSGVRPDARNMAVLSDLATAIDPSGAGRHLVSGGNSASIEWALGGATGRVNDLRLGESILLGREPSRRRPIDGLHLDATSLSAEVIEASRKPSRPWGDLGETAFGAGPARAATGARGGVQVIVALGRQDVDPDGLVAPPGTVIRGSSSDHLVLEMAGGRPPAVGTELVFGVVGYAALLRAMTSPFVERRFLDGAPID
ncbi:MAG: alanine/ornithine racemase family PLP-dependent enzyme [Microthrixaceae bacterium]